MKVPRRVVLGVVLISVCYLLPQVLFYFLWRENIIDRVPIWKWVHIMFLSGSVAIGLEAWNRLGSKDKERPLIFGYKQARDTLVVITALLVGTSVGASQVFVSSYLLKLLLILGGVVILFIVPYLLGSDQLKGQVRDILK